MPHRAMAEGGVAEGDAATGAPLTANNIGIEKASVGMGRAGPGALARAAAPGISASSKAVTTRVAVGGPTVTAGAAGAAAVEK